jgi:probable phosphoglycerate mutase
MKEIYLLRHGETEWNVEGRFQGGKDSPLTVAGREQAQKVGRILAGLLGKETKLSLHVSPQGRAVETSGLIQQQIKFASVETKSELREVSFGDWEGRRHADIVAENPTLAEKFGKRRALLYAPNAESFEEVKKRVHHWMDSLTSPVVALSHGISGRAIRGVYLGLSVEESLILPVPQDAVWHLHDGKADLLTED